ncbi:hypothetical protein [Photobacterium sp. TY1-4]|uniref:hypothetical protein n=1 Tax=Photobacterium sp. TY1-4 TaxID=2899122 RepID=UPI0021C04CA7|nr:hypothetical protein [Photobacterium sp. TY1-4]UXI02450.1 hypothetical protein NH461_06710 [Photobacterium sp. TY1-4]
MKKVSIALASLLMGFSALSYADIQVTDTQNGAWVTVTDGGQPSANAVVSVVNQPQAQNSFRTDDSGRVFIPLSLNHSRSVKYSAVTESGNEYSRFAFHGVRKN